MEVQDVLFFLQSVHAAGVLLCMVATAVCGLVELWRVSPNATCREVVMMVPIGLCSGLGIGLLWPVHLAQLVFERFEQSETVAERPSEYSATAAEWRRMEHGRCWWESGWIDFEDEHGKGSIMLTEPWNFGHLGVALIADDTEINAWVILGKGATAEPPADNLKIQRGLRAMKREFGDDWLEILHAYHARFPYSNCVGGPPAFDPVAHKEPASQSGSATE